MSRNVKLIVICGIATLIGLGVAWAVSQGGQTYAGWPVFLIVTVWAFALNWLIYIPSALVKTEHYFDLTGALTYLTAIGIALYLTGEPDIRAWIAAGMVTLWAVRLGTFLFLRVKRVGKDRRFDERKTHALRFLVTWTVQALWVVLTAACALLILTDSESVALSWGAYIGIALWVIGFAIEVAADAQKTAFKKDPANEGKFISSGLWAWSRHPNYFGEIVLWTGMAVLALPLMNGWQWAALISPVFVYLLLTKASGIPILEKQAKEKWGGDPAFEAYMNSTPRLIPRPPKG